MMPSVANMTKPSKMAGHTQHMHHNLPPMTPIPLTGPRRIGSWPLEEIKYTHFLSALFKSSRLENVPSGTSLRQWLGKQLNCAPMRLSKKFDKVSGMLGLVKFEVRQDVLDAMTPAQRRAQIKEMHDLRTKLEVAVAREMAGLKPLAHHLEKHGRPMVSASVMHASPKKNRARKFTNDDNDILFKGRLSLTSMLQSTGDIVPRKSNRNCVRRSYSYDSSDESEVGIKDEHMEPSMEPLPFHPPTATSAAADWNAAAECHITGRPSAALTLEDLEWIGQFMDDLPSLDTTGDAFWTSIREIDCLNPYSAQLLDTSTEQTPST
ncbi:hypothetical protein DYB28_004000 [Aphanomyces astaci]|uniref:Uncharacterized protein n=1 Tax=Aphanomyces astaci TaxID=112090 RepID=A0A9X8E0Y6_APHAT|nr:hypothetical protein DYB28_004000 [Aphanomyces astaci]